MTSWWNKNVETRIEDFKAWIGDANQPSKIYCRKYITNKKYKSMIDCGCGLATDYFGMVNDGRQIAYMGLDSCKYLVNLNTERGVPMIEAELEEELPVADNAYEVSYCREVLEHLSYYENIINELIRIASKEVIIVFFIKPDDEEKINYWEEEDLYHNKYNKSKLESFIMSNPKVKGVLWKDILDIPYDVRPTASEMSTNEAEAEVKVERPTGEKSILHIILK